MKPIVEAVRGSAGEGSLPAPAIPEAVTEAEKSAEELPKATDWNDLAEIYQGGPDPSGQIPAGLVSVYDWGPWLTSGPPPVRCGARMRATTGLMASPWQSG